MLAIFIVLTAGCPSNNSPEQQTEHCSVAVSGFVLITGCWFRSSSSSKTGGAILISGKGSVLLSRSTFIECFSEDNGGAVHSTVAGSLEFLCADDCEGYYGATFFVQDGNLSQITVTHGTGAQGGTAYCQMSVLKDVSSSDCSTNGIGQVIYLASSQLHRGIMAHWTGNYAGHFAALSNWNTPTECYDCIWQDATVTSSISSLGAITICTRGFFSQVTGFVEGNGGSLIVSNSRFTTGSFPVGAGDGGGSVFNVQDQPPLDWPVVFQLCPMAAEWPPVATATPTTCFTCECRALPRGRIKFIDSTFLTLPFTLFP
jgi:hypothetical protein